MPYGHVTHYGQGIGPPVPLRIPLWELIRNSGPHSCYFQWDDFVRQTKLYTAWHVPITFLNCPGLVTLFSNLPITAMGRFQDVFYGDPMGYMTYVKYRFVTVGS